MAAFSDIEGWQAVSKADRVFGYDDWDRDTVASQCVWSKAVGERYGAFPCGQPAEYSGSGKRPSISIRIEVH